MASMNISLPDSLREFIETEVREGRYRSTSEYFGKLVRDQQRSKAQDRLERLLHEGQESEAAEMTPDDWGDLRRRVRARHESPDSK